jgi:serine phosphatase RsbU (regulator of sigma subunit)
MIHLHVVPAIGEAFDHLAEGDALVIGRAEGADLKLMDRYLSRRHARLYRQGGGLMLEDLASRGGTFLNDRLLAGPAAVNPGDTIRIGGNLLTVHSDTAPALDAMPRSSSATELFRPATDLLLAGPPVGGAPETSLARYAERLKVMNDVHQALSRSISLSELLELILDRVFDHLAPEEGAIVLRGRDGEFYRATIRTTAAAQGGRLYSRSLLHEVAEKGMAALVLDVEQDERFNVAPSFIASGIRSLVAAPLLDGDGCMGMIALGSRMKVRQFSAEDLELLVSLASVAALRIRNVALAEEAAERRRMKEELELARQIQVGLLPARLPEVAGYALHGANLASRGVSGDYYLVQERSGGAECVLMIADVSGKGITAALLAASLEALSAGPITEGLPPPAVCERIAPLLYSRTSAESFATAFLGVLEPATGRFRYANAGHNPGLLVRASGEVEQLLATGTPLGVLPAASYEAAEVTLAGGDTLVLYTDGIVEATDPDDEEYGLERLIEAVLRHRGQDLERLARGLDADLEAFVRGTPFADDRTLVLAHRLVQ